MGDHIADAGVGVITGKQVVDLGDDLLTRRPYATAIESGYGNTAGRARRRASVRHLVPVRPVYITTAHRKRNGDYLILPTSTTRFEVYRLTVYRLFGHETQAVQ